MKILWNPWRYQYIKNAGKEGECLFCNLRSSEDRGAYIVLRGERAFAVLNAYPYNSGHLMIAPYEHVGDLEELDDETLLEMMGMLKLLIRALKKAMNPDGFNIGVNIGRAAGAGVPGHVHIHLVPRWTGDTNFMGVIAGAKTLPAALDETYNLIKSALEELPHDGQEGPATH